VPELLQDDANPERVAETILRMLGDKLMLDDIRSEFTNMHENLRQDNAEKAAQAVLAYLS
jgi:lipid-A-disaccharide synthase